MTTIPVGPWRVRRPAVQALLLGFGFLSSGLGGSMPVQGAALDSAAGPAPPDSVTVAVYSALIDQHYDRGLTTPLIISSASLDRPEDMEMDDHFHLMLQSALNPLSTGTLAAMDAFPAEAGNLSLRLRTHRPCRIVSKAVLDSLFAFCPGGWDRFADKFPGVRGYITLSRIAWDPGLSQALVYTEDHCGMWCAEGTYVLLEKEEGAWKVSRKLTLWVS